MLKFVHENKEALVARKGWSIMRKKQDKFACVIETKKRGNMVVFAIAVLAICISGALYARKLQMEEKYISQASDVYYAEAWRAAPLRQA